MYDYEGRFLIPTEKEKIFTSHKKQELTTLEKIGLEAILTDFCVEYEELTTGEKPDPDRIKNYIRYNENDVDFLDGYSDTYIFDNYAILSLWVTDSGCIVLECADLDAYEGDDMETYTENENDYFEIVDRFDICSDFNTVLFRLN